MARQELWQGLVVGLATIPWAGCGTSQVHFVAPEQMKIEITPEPGHGPSTSVVLPAKIDLPEGKITWLRLSEIPGHQGLEVWASVEMLSRGLHGASSYFRDHCTIPVVFEADDFDQIMANNLVTKVIYLPDPEYQEVAIGGPAVAAETLVSTRLEPGMDPVQEAKKKGTILAIVRMGNRKY